MFLVFSFLSSFSLKAVFSIAVRSSEKKQPNSLFLLAKKITHLIKDK